MKETTAYIVTSLREYENNEQYFGCDGIFLSEEAAKSLIAEDVAELREQYPDATYTENENRFELKDGVHRFVWQIETGVLPIELFLAPL